MMEIHFAFFLACQRIPNTLSLYRLSQAQLCLTVLQLVRATTNDITDCVLKFNLHRIPGDIMQGLFEQG